MPGDPLLCRQNAARCAQLAAGLTDPHLKEALADVAQTWEQLADKIEAADRIAGALLTRVPSQAQ
ncbi:MAG: hypothetical protein ACJ8D0_05800, partial [Xanthobacteraceae bacterium]|jgi:hypothetical protein